MISDGILCYNYVQQPILLSSETICCIYGSKYIMRNEVKIGLVVLGSAAAGILGAWLFFSAMSGSTEKSAQEQRLAKCVRSGSVKKITEISVDRKAGKSLATAPRSILRITRTL